MVDSVRFKVKRVWVVAKGYRPEEGGMQTYAEGVAEAYAAMGAAVTVFTQTSAGPREVADGSVHLVDIGPGKGPAIPFRFLRAMKREQQINGIPIFTHGTTWRTSVIPMILGLPYITTFHGREFMYVRGPMLALMRKVAKCALRCVAVSHYTAERLVERLGRGTLHPVVAWNGLSHWMAGIRSAENRTDIPAILTLCRLEPRKNILACIQACALIHAEGVAFHYTIAGRGPDLEEARQLVRAQGLEQVVEITGFVSSARAAQLYAQADIFLHPQTTADCGRDFEGFGIAIADAMAAGAAVVVGEEGGAQELLEHGISGLVVAGSDTSSIAAALRRLLTQESFRRDLAEAGQRRAQSLFTWQRHVQSINEAFDKNG